MADPVYPVMAEGHSPREIGSSRSSTADDEGRDCYREAARTVAQLRVVLSLARKSPDFAARTDSTVRTNASRQRRAAHALWASLSRLPSNEVSGQDTRGLQLPPPSFFFTPMGTAPATTLWPDPQDTSVDEVGTENVPEHVSRARPSWDASTLLTSDRPSPRSTPDGGRHAAPRFRPQREEVAPAVATPLSTSTPTSDSRTAAAATAAPATRGAASFVDPEPAVDASTASNGRQDVVEAVALERAVRDYLRRMNILGRDHVPDGESGETSSSAAVFGDALYNGAALCQLLRCTLSLVRGGSQSAQPRTDAVPRRRPKTLRDVRANYTAALSALSDGAEELRSAAARQSPGQQVDGVPAHFFRLTPEDVYQFRRPSALLEVYFYLISNFLPSPEQLPVADAALTWQPPADSASFRQVAPLVSESSALQLRAAELRACDLLYACAALPDPQSSRLPGDECLVPGPLAAPFVPAPAWWTNTASPNGTASRLQPPLALYVPSVYPFLTNGVALCALARHLLPANDVPLVIPFPVPRTRGNCMKNIAAALEALGRITRMTLPASVREDVYKGDRRCIVAVLDSVAQTLSAVEANVPQAGYGRDARRRASGLPESATSSFHSSSGSQSHSAVANDTATRDAAARVHCSPPRPLDRSPPRGERVAAPSRLASRGPEQTRVPAGARQAPPKAVTVTLPGDAFPQREIAVLRQWLVSVLGSGFQYAAEDGSFHFDSGTFSFTEPCYIFSDGVLLAHLLRALECCRCEDVECVRPTSKRPAKRFNIRRCLQFLREKKGLVPQVPLLDELLLSGELSGVLSLLQSLRSKYRVA